MQNRRLSAFQFNRPASPAQTELHPLTREDSSVPREPFDTSASPRHDSTPASTLEPVESLRSSPSTRNTSGTRQRASVSTAPSHIYLNKSPATSRASATNEEIPTIRIDREAIPGTFEVLAQWSAVAADRQAKRQFLEDRKRKESEIRAGQTHIDAIYAKLLRSVETPPPTTWQRLLSALQRPFGSSSNQAPAAVNGPNSHPRPTDKELLTLSHHCYPPRFSAKALVCDFGDDRSHFEWVEVRNVEFYWQSKPDWSYVRWIHVPFGRGVAHSSVEDLFLHAHTLRRPFTNGGESVWPFLQTEILNFRSAYNFKRMRDTFIFCSENTPENKALLQQLDESTFGGECPGHLKDDMEWRADFIGTSTNFWDLVQTDMPFELSEGGGLSDAFVTNYQYTRLGQRNGLKLIDRQAYPRGSPIHKQALSRHPYFAESQMVRNDFRAFHGDDGFLLTMSAANGVDLLDPQFQHYLNLPQQTLFENPDASIFGRTIERFKEHGCRWWYRKTAEWLLVYLITEFGTSPHPLNGGVVSPSLGESYTAVVLDLNRRRYDPWQKNETISLVRDMLACADELAVLVSIHAKKIKLFRGVIQDCREMEAEDISMGKLPDNAASESTLIRAQHALRMTEEAHNCYVRLLADLKESLGSLFQLRSIEQDELSKLADKQNKAVVIFTAVTIVFLPLSFFTSYFGMNLSDLTGNEHTQAYFWELCGSIAFVLVVSVLLFAYRHHIPFPVRNK